MKLFKSLVNLLFPRVCAACGNILLEGEDSVCTTCRFLLPKTGYENNPDNPLAQMFYGQMPFNAVMAEFFFSKTGKVQHLIHGLKYHHCRENGIFLGQEIGKSLLKAPDYQGIDFIIPIPLHPKKEKLRGYNQSLVIAEGIHEIMNVPIAEKSLVRSVFTDTQTKKSREERYQNVKDIFELKKPEQLQGKHVLLVDDVLTTGATLMSAGKALLHAEGIKISVATVACASN
ncbi:MAG: ComF family protein [Bacteroidales bacterium]|nr:ComF family protein [Bacteroidales bacterium]MBQ3845888.1 ComF family protein [Bacteroidales bacterium]